MNGVALGLNPLPELFVNEGKHSMRLLRVLLFSACHPTNSQIVTGKREGRAGGEMHGSVPAHGEGDKGMGTTSDLTKVCTALL